MAQQMSGCLSFLFCCGKVSDEGNLREKGLTLAYSLQGVESLVMLKTWHRSMRPVDHIVSADRKQEQEVQ